MTPARKAERLRSELLKYLKRVLSDPDFAAGLMKWFHEHPEEWLRFKRGIKSIRARPLTRAAMNTVQTVPPHERVAACRGAVLDYLAPRSVAAFDAQDMAEVMNNREVLRLRHNAGGPDWTVREVQRAADSLVARGWARFHFTWFCDRKYYQATEEGVRAHAQAMEDEV